MGSGKLISTPFGIEAMMLRPTLVSRGVAVSKVASLTHAHPDSPSGFELVEVKLPMQTDEPLHDGAFPREQPDLVRARQKPARE